MDFNFSSCGYSMHSGPNTAKNVTLHQLIFRGFLKERNFCPLWYNACTVLKLDFFFSPPYFLIGSDHLSTRCSILTYVFMYSRYVQPRDAGLYECQVSTEPKMSHFVQLNIVGKKIHFSTSLFLVYYTQCIMYPTTCISRTYCHNWG